MSNILTPTQAERIDKLYVKCCVCNQNTTDGVKQTRIYALENGKTAQMNLYMCMKCIGNGEPWPGVKPYTGMKNQQIQGEFDRFKDNRRFYKK